MRLAEMSLKRLMTRSGRARPPATEAATARRPDHDVDGVRAAGRRFLGQAGELVAEAALVLVLRLGRCVLLLLLAPLLVQFRPPGLLSSVRLAFVRLQT